MILLIWIGFLILILALLALDLGVLNRKAHVIYAKEALLWTAFWVFLSLAFNVLVYYMYQHHWLGIGDQIGHQLSGGEAALNFFTGYLIEKSLSLDNIFVIALIFSYFKVPAMYQHRVLFWGILGALVMRGIMILAGVALIQRFIWMVYVFGGMLILTSIKMLTTRHDKLEPDRNPLVRVARHLYPVSQDFEGKHFFTRVDGKRAITPLFLVLLVIESTDVLFAIDSIPAIFAITYDPFIVFTSNVFAILGLRSLYFALAAIIEKFKYVKISLVIILAYVGLKMILTHHYKIPTHVSLIVICVLLLAGIVASVLVSRNEEVGSKASIADEKRVNKK
jgi:TerC family integral membrane protein